MDAGAEVDFADGPTQVRLGTTAVVLVRLDGVICAFDALCPHKFGPLADGTVEAGRLVCPLHDAHFGPDGTPRDGDGWAGTLRPHPVRVVDGRIQVQID